MCDFCSKEVAEIMEDFLKKFIPVKEYKFSMCFRCQLFYLYFYLTAYCICFSVFDFSLPAFHLSPAN